MSPITFNTNPIDAAQDFFARIQSSVRSLKDDPLFKRIKNMVTPDLIMGFGVGLVLHKVYSPLTEKIVNLFGVSIKTLPDPFDNLSLGAKIVLTPMVCIGSPIFEEILFRKDLQEYLKKEFHSFYKYFGFLESTATMASRVTAVFFSSIIFGLAHFTNAASFKCDPILFLPQVVATTLMGLVFGFAKEFSGTLQLPIGMHIGNNAIGWVEKIRASL